MGHRYYAKVTFPRAALGIVDIRNAVDAFITAENGSWGYEHEHWEDEDEDTITLSHSDANYGEIWAGERLITDLLDDNKVPYDWYHDESEGGGDSFTTCVRWKDGEKVETTTDEASDARLELASQLSKSIENGATLDEIGASLGKVLMSAPTPLSDLNWSL